MFRRAVAVVLSVFVANLLLSASVWAQKPAGSVTVGPGDIFSTNLGSARYTCGKVGSRWLPGAYVAKSRVLFLSYAAELKNVKKSLRSASGTKKKKLSSRQNKLNSLIRGGTQACSSGPPSGTPGSGPGAQPTPTPTIAPGNFASNGDVTPLGKSTFGIPSNFSANVNTGKSIFDGLCRQCHTTNNEPLNKRFPTIKQAIENAPMFITKPDHELAHLTAYLNRFKRY